MSWRLSQFRKGDLVEVCSKAEILATLDKNGCIDGMPFMPEMLKFCGQRFRIRAVAHKSCETAYKTWKARRLQTTVHLDDLRCDGSAHGGCQADCSLFWKDQWLKPAEIKDTHAVKRNRAMPINDGVCTEASLQKSTRADSGAEVDKPRYSCQTTLLYGATKPLAWWDIRQYIYDVVTRNRKSNEVFRILWLAFLKELFRKSPIGYRAIKLFREWMNRRLTGRGAPDFSGVIPRNEPTPTQRLNLKPGEQVRVKTKEEIIKTLHTNGSNRGMYFDVEMIRYCGTTATVRNSVARIIDEVTGEMLHMKNPCIILEGSVCNAEHSDCRLMCPRAIPSFWREIWLERLGDNQS